MVVLGDGNRHLVLAGGLTAADTSANGVFRLNVVDGTLTAIATLPVAVHDAAGAVIDGQATVIGGGSTSTFADVQGFPMGGGAASVVAQLPQPRSDDSATTTGSTTVVVGGYDGTTADPSVLTTTNGTTYTVAGTLPVPVRYAAVAALGHNVYVFGGLATSGPDAGQPVRTVQQIDLARGTSSVLSPLPEPLEGASAFTLDGRIFVAGGDTATAGSGPGALTSSATIWAFIAPSTTGGSGSTGAAAGTSSFAAAGTLAEAVSNAGTAVDGAGAWLVGGEHNGTQVDVAQHVVPAG